MHGCWPFKPKGKHAVTQRSSSPQDTTASSAGPRALRCHGCKGGEGEAVSTGNTHTHSPLLTGGWALTAIWRWHSSHIAHWASCACLMQHAASTVTSMTCFLPPPFEKAVIPLWLLMNISLYSRLCGSTAADRLIHYRPAPLLPGGISTGHPSPHPAPRRSVDTPSIILPSPHRLCGPVNGAFLSCSSSWWFTVLLHKLTVGISQCLNTEKPYYSLMRQGSCRMADGAKAVVLDFPVLKFMWSKKHIILRLSLSLHAGILICFIHITF